MVVHCQCHGGRNPKDTRVVFALSEWVWLCLCLALIATASGTTRTNQFGAHIQNFKFHDSFPSLCFSFPATPWTTKSTLLSILRNFEIRFGQGLGGSMGKLGLRSVIIQTLVWGNHSNRNTAGLRVLHGHSHHGKYGLDANSRAVLAKLAFVWCVFKCYVWINRKFRQSLSAPDWVSRLWKRQRRDLRSCTKTLSRRTTDTGNRDAVVADSPRSGTITEVQAGPISCSKSPYMYVGHRLGNSSGPTSDMSSSQPSRLQGDYDAEHEIIELDYNPHSGPDALSMDDGRHIAHSLCERASPDHEHDISRPAFGSDTIFPLPPEWFRRWDRKASV